MTTLQRIQRSVFFIKLTNWEYWSLYLANLPLLIIWLWFALRARRLFFFTAVNPVIETGGMWGESKIGILRRIPEAYLPKTVFVEKNADFQAVIQEVKSTGMDFPLIAKPDIGERGLLVTKIKNETELARYAEKNRIAFLIQEFLDLPLELAVLCHRMPGKAEGEVTSICIKETLKVTGDGHSSVRALMDTFPRAKLQIPRFEQEFPDMLKRIPAADETLELEPIGNHCRGTMFLNGNPHINAALSKVFDSVLAQMEGVQYGRFDLKCRSIEDIRSGGGFKVMEFNGIGAEPAHIYDPAYPFLDKHRDIYRHWRIIYRIYQLQKARGVQAMTLGEAFRSLKKYADYKKSLRQ